jgi:4-hydroxy-3-polyprenylbenzoate decarboxylase
VLTEGPLDQLDHSPTLESYGGKLGLDATHKGPDEGARPWPQEIEMSEEVRALVEQRWAEYGIELPDRADDRPIRHSPSALRQVIRR